MPTSSAVFKQVSLEDAELPLLLDFLVDDCVGVGAAVVEGETTLLESVVEVVDDAVVGVKCDRLVLVTLGDSCVPVVDGLISSEGPARYHWGFLRCESPLSPSSVHKTLLYLYKN